MKNPTFADRYPIAFIVLLTDVFVVFCAAGIASYLRFDQYYWPIHYQVVTSIVSLLFVINCLFSGVYNSWRGLNLIRQLLKLFGCWVVAFFILAALLVFTKQNDFFSRWWMGLWFVAGVSISCLYRGSVFWLLRVLRKQGRNVKSVAIIGKGKAVDKIQDKSSLHHEYGFKVACTIDLSTLGKGNSLHSLLQEFCLNDIHEIWICLPLKDGELLKEILYELRTSTADIRYFPDFEDLRLLNHKVTNILGMYALDLSSTAIDGTSHWIKWIEDIILGTLISLLILPVCLLIAIAIKLTSPGPVLFKQYRNGVGGKKFKVYKFRTMEVHQEEDGKVTQATLGDPRITKLGALLRKTSLDELPQFYNVLQGRMAIVGPRPHALSHNEYYMDLVESYMWRHKVKPGITGWAQVNGYRGEIDTLDKMKKRVRYDLWYIENWSLWLDLKIIFWSVFKGFVNNKAY